MEPSITTAGARRSSDGRIAAALSLVSILVVVGLWGISHASPSAKQRDDVALPVVTVSGDVGCSNFTSFWGSDSGVNVPADSVIGLTNCRVDSQGKWFVPTGAHDPRLTAADTLTPDERRAVDPLREQLENDLDSLTAVVPKSLTEGLKANFDPINQPVYGHTRRNAPTIVDKRSRYIRIARAMMVSPDRDVLAEYVGWATNRREAAAANFVAACHASTDFKYLWRACDGVPAEFQAGYMPLLWDLTDPVLIQDYLIYRARSGEPLPTSTNQTSIQEGQ
jgi:hypothetical protein